MKRPRALLTGGNGFTGHYLARELEMRGYEVFGLANHAHNDLPNMYHVDLLDRVNLARAVVDIRPDSVFHLAAVTFVAHDDVDEIYRVNVVGTRNLLQALTENSKKPNVVVLASSANIYGNVDVELISENTTPRPANDYAVSKLAMEYMSRLWMNKLPIVITRPFNYTGVGQPQRFLIPKIVSHFARGEKKIELGNIDVYRDFSDVRDVAKTYGELAALKTSGMTLNVCSGHGYSIRDILSFMTEISGRSIDVEVNPAFVRDNEVKRLIGSDDALRRVGASFSTIPFRETLEWMYTQMRSEEANRNG